MIDSGLSSKGDWKDPTTGEKVEKHYIVFNWLFAVGVGGFIAYILLLYCIDVGVRVVQLLYLQIIYIVYKNKKNYVIITLYDWRILI